MPQALLQACMEWELQSAEKTQLVTLSGPNKLGLKRGMMLKTDEQKHCVPHLSFLSSYFCLPAYIPQLSKNCKAIGMIRLICYSCLHCQNKQNWTLKMNLEFVTTCARADLHHYFPCCFPAVIFQLLIGKSLCQQEELMGDVCSSTWM